MSKQTKQTSIDWLIEQVEELINAGIPQQIIDQAKAMEKEQAQKMIDDALTNYEIGWADRRKQQKLYTEEQVMEAIDRARNYNDGWVETENEIIQSLKQPKQ